MGKHHPPMPPSPKQAELLSGFEGLGRGVIEGVLRCVTVRLSAWLWLLLFSRSSRLSVVESEGAGVVGIFLVMHPQV